MEDVGRVGGRMRREPEVEQESEEGCRAAPLSVLPWLPGADGEPLDVEDRMLPLERLRVEKYGPLVLQPAELEECTNDSEERLGVPLSNSTGAALTASPATLDIRRIDMTRTAASRTSGRPNPKGRGSRTEGSS